MERFNLQDRIGDVGALYPGALEIFARYDIDFCCGGNRPLEEAVTEAGIDGNKLLKILNEGYEKFLESGKDGVTFNRMPSDQLSDHIVNTHHVYMKDTLPLIEKLSSKIVEVHGGRHPELKEVNRLFMELKSEIEKHLAKEEDVLFPLVKAHDEGCCAEAERLLTVVGELRQEHEAAGSILKSLRHVTGHYRVPDDSCQTYAFTYAKLQEMENDLYHHIHLENNILFKRLEG